MNDAQMNDAQGFPAFARQQRSTRGRSWWARAWVQAMEDTSLDSDQLRKGRRYANSGQVGTITISPGRTAATVYSPEDTYESVVRVDELSSDDWHRFSGQVAARAGHIAALLDGEMPHDLVEAAADAGVTLLPGIGDLDPSCTCDAWELPCQHAAALCYQVAWLLDADPFVLLLLRGRTRDALLDELQLSATRPTEAGVSVADVLASTPAELPDVPELPAKVSGDELAVTGIEPPEGFGPAVLQLLVLDAARRARAILNALLRGTREPQLLDEWQDAVRLAADFPELTAPLTEGTGRDLALGIQAWRYGGGPGLDVLEHTWTPDPAELNRARTELLAADDDLAVTTALNQLTIGADTQLRLDHDGRWHPYRLVDATWIPAGTPSKDPLVIEW
ncbi:putative Zn finger protein [Kribbella rubisoli]|uniref:Zn finger protein n=1 Tax=Kribbella rubisoli TaxID=3075929 RepID=A0A4Q7WKJ5_9ACTN|nr:SWIM zinc finger family protein [Kribbella rubisoli]RZU10574.1 putative Zn finger protein [Kribbella rubisoli]